MYEIFAYGVGCLPLYGRRGRRMIKQKIKLENCKQGADRVARSCQGRVCVAKSHMEKIGEGQENRPRGAGLTVSFWDF